MVFPFIIAGFSAIISTVATIGAAVSTFCTTTLPALIPYIEKGLEVMQLIAKVAEGVATVLDIFNPSDNIEDMGDRALQAAEQGIKPDQFDEFSNYLIALRGLDDFNPNKNSDKTMEKIVAGLAIAGAGIDQKFDWAEGTAAQYWPLVGASTEYFTADKFLQIIATGSSISAVANYFTGKLGGAEALHVEDALVQMESKTHPNLDPNTIRAEIYAQQDKVQLS